MNTPNEHPSQPTPPPKGMAECRACLCHYKPEPGLLAFCCPRCSDLAEVQHDAAEAQREAGKPRPFDKWLWR